jgi:hypothetical protein
MLHRSYVAVKEILRLLTYYFVYHPDISCDVLYRDAEDPVYLDTFMRFLEEWVLLQLYVKCSKKNLYGLDMQELNIIGPIFKAKIRRFEDNMEARKFSTLDKIPTYNQSNALDNLRELQQRGSVYDYFIYKFDVIFSHFESDVLKCE